MHTCQHAYKGAQEARLSSWPHSRRAISRPVVSGCENSHTSALMRELVALAKPWLVR